MPIQITVPRLGWSMEEGAFVAWLKQDGEWVQAGDALFSIEGDKAVQEIDSMDSGILRIAPDAPGPGAPIKVGDLLGHLLTREEAARHAPAAGPAASPSSVPPPGAAPSVAKAATSTSSLNPTTDAGMSPARIQAAALRSVPGASTPRRPAISPRALR